MEYVINVAKRDASTDRMCHLFRVIVYTHAEAKRVYDEIKAHFDSYEYDVSVTRWETKGVNVYFDEEDD